MNKDRRSRILDATSALDEAVDIIRDVIDEEQEAYDNMPEGLQGGARGESMLDAIDKMEGYIDNIENVKSVIESGVNKL